MTEQSNEYPLLRELAGISGSDEGRRTVFAAVRQVRRGQTRSGQPFYDLRIADQSGSAMAKVWSDAARCMQVAEHLEPGNHVKVLFETETYQGAIQLNVKGLRLADPGEVGYSPDTLVEEGYNLVSDILCETLVFDIETAPAVDLRKVPSTVAQAVTKHADRSESDEGKVMSLSPYFGQVVSMAVGEGEDDPHSQNVTVFAVLPPDVEVGPLPAWIRAVSEPDLLRAFWALAARSKLVVSYNGRGFDVPFLVGRSLIHDVPVRVDLLTAPYLLRPHLDLFNALHGGRGGRGPASLDVVCWALGLASPKEAMDGSMVASTYARGDLEMIAKYNAGDVRATTAVYQRVRDGMLRHRDDW